MSLCACINVSRLAYSQPHKYTNKWTHCTYLFVCMCRLYVLQIEIPYMSYVNMGCESSDAWRITSTGALQMESTPSRSGNHNGNPKNPTTSHQPKSMHSLLVLLIDCYSWDPMNKHGQQVKKHHQDKSWQEPSTQRIPIEAITDKTI